ncbi:succinylglutamate desuccinylase/aspartoacylase family protein [Mesorhizobium sp. VK24D]|uniref:Succinylglutamate desuccinylase/aspartoacylase family protein n=1 Tax=Mesorhizobium album TaxID=3072314 RepID=A0ABU4XYU9_9HYPH|nr:succinylglutamate desuccinylase/aspartoacylase family protein [Mesorhizobium sp. VK24D]MDX8479867.1 succinylglutamate desuccinylase/aspartoacylase family protein [Mesorhizobium sp. VK24D]
MKDLMRFSHPKLADFAWPHCEIRGARPGPRLCISAGVHVNEVSAIEAAVRLQKLFRPQALAGSVSIIPLLNQPARFHYSEYVCPLDGKNINFTFPGRPDGTFSDLLCQAVMNEWTAGADCYVDLHGGDLRENVCRYSIYQRTGDEAFDAHARALARCFDAQVILGLPPASMLHPGRPPTGFARDGRYAVMSEAGSHGLVEESCVEFHVNGVLNIARYLGMIDEPSEPFRNTRNACNDNIWVEAPADGEFFANIEPGDRVARNQLLGGVRDLFGEPVAELRSPADGIVLWRMTHPTLRKGMWALAIATEEPAV